MKRILSPFFLYYLRILSKIQLKKTNPVIIGIGGSSGKSSVSLFIALILKSKFKILQTGGKNSETGIPLTILGINPRDYTYSDWLAVSFKALISLFTNHQKYDAFVSEMGIDSPKPPKNMAYLLKVVNPSIAVLTNISLEHSMYFEDHVKDGKNKEEILDLIAKEETLLIRSLNKNSHAVVNIDDLKISEVLNKVSAKVISVSTKDKNATYYLASYEVNDRSTEFKFLHNQKAYKLVISQPLPFFYSYSLLLSIAVSSVLDIDTDSATDEIERSFKLPPGRLSVFEGVKNTTIIDSSYNNSIEALEGAIDLVSSIGAGRRKIAIFGDIREQGNQSKHLHQELAEKIIERLDKVILIGPLLMRYTMPILEDRNFDYESYKTFSHAKRAIESLVKEKDIVLIKGSQNNLLLERAVEMLLKDKKDLSLLCRRGSFWDRQREITP